SVAEPGPCRRARKQPQFSLSRVKWNHMHFLRILLLLAATVTPAIAASDAKSFGAWRVTCDGQTTDGMALCAASQTVA
ncbi:MAG: hypothetical protein O3B08_08240, partial [Proteobacteria bacterium]|nr:hypothetical protein [Pseudomonadota bacterium]